jgi:ribosomal protein S18 acetylase RimI-like enzyme
MDNLQIRFGEPADAAQIADLFPRSSRPDVAQLLICGCKGASEYIRMQLAAGVRNAESAYFVAQGPGRIIGAVELRRRSNGLFLNHIAVHHNYRGQRVGAVLFSTAVTMSGVNSGQIGLDVFHDNVSALHWYSRLGFATTTSAEFIELAPPGGADEDPAYVSALPQADLCQERFGFSRFDLITGNGTFSVGRIGETWFRLIDLAAIGSPSVFATLKLLDPARRIFAIVPASSAPPAQVVRLLATAHRMGAEIAHLMSSLSDDCQKSRGHVSVRATDHPFSSCAGGRRCGPS